MSIVAVMLVAMGMVVAEPFAPPVVWPDLAVPQECNPSYGEALARAKSASAKGQYQAAVEAFTRAIDTPCHEIPNFELYGPLAEAFCRAGEVARGRSLLEDYECMLAVDVGDRQCYANAGDTSATPVRASGLTDRCFTAMCGEILLPYYDQPTEAVRAHVARLRAAVKQVVEMCGRSK